MICMPSKGSPIIPTRIPQLVLSMIDEEVEITKARKPTYTRSAFIAEAINEKLRHRARSRGKKK